MYFEYDAEMVCPKCGTLTDQESVDIGVGIIYGPHGCPNCGWSEDSEYDLSTPDKTGIGEDGSFTDQYGVVYPAGNPVAIAMRNMHKHSDE